MSARLTLNPASTKPIPLSTSKIILVIVQNSPDFKNTCQSKNRDKNNHSTHSRTGHQS